MHGKGTSRWDRLDALAPSPPGQTRAPGWWPTRILLGIGIASVVMIGLGVIAQTALGQGISEASFSLGPLLIPSSVAILGGALAVAVVGLIWMIRIFRASEGGPPPWRHRRH